MRTRPRLHGLSLLCSGGGGAPTPLSHDQAAGVANLAFLSPGDATQSRHTDPEKPCVAGLLGHAGDCLSIAGGRR